MKPSSGRGAPIASPLALAACVWSCASACAQPAQPWGPATAASTPEPSAPGAPQAPPVRRRDVEGAIGLILAHRPAFSGSSDRQLRPELAGFVRWGRYSLSGPGGFTTRARDDVERGLDALIVKREGLRVNLSLRFDPGRRESSSDQLMGMGDVPATVRARLSLRWEPAPAWALQLGGSFDALNRVGGYVLNGSVSRSFEVGPRQRLILGASLSGAGDRYMQTWYGVTSAQSAASGYPVYDAPGGLRDVSASATWRVEFDDHWAGFTSLGMAHLLGPAADSPLVRQRDDVTLAIGLARRF